MARKFDPGEVSAWLEAQILATQIDWMDHFTSGNEELRRQQEAVLDGIYAFRQYFLEIPAPAPGQGYEPPDAKWAEVTKGRRIAALDAQISELTAQRQAILGEPVTVCGIATLVGASTLVATG